MLGQAAAAPGQARSTIRAMHSSLKPKAPARRCRRQRDREASRRRLDSGLSGGQRCARPSSLRLEVAVPLPSPCARDRIPPRGGVGLKAEHYHTILEALPDIGFFEVHAENYMGAGGPPHRYLSAIRERYKLSLHGVGLSIGADRPLDKDHLKRLNRLVLGYRPGLFSEPLAWSSHDIGLLNDLLPVPYTAETLVRVVEHIDQIQNALGRQMLLENPSTYLAFAESTYSEIGFIAELVRRTGCSLLLDVNNVYVASPNQQWAPVAYIDPYPLAHFQEIHLAGHTESATHQHHLLSIATHN